MYWGLYCSLVSQPMEDYSFNDVAVYKENNFFSAIKDALELVPHHDDFNVINPLGNKVFTLLLVICHLSTCVA